MIRTGILLLLLLLTFQTSSPAAVEMPFSPGVSSPAQPRDEVACGFVETTWDDPDWVFACSDHILRSTVCLAPEDCFGGGYQEYWFNRAFAPCYTTNRYWKFPENSGSGYSYPMSALGVGTFDGLYLRRNVRFQLYSGTGDSQPYGPEMHGPTFVSIDWWAQYFPECGEFEPGTFLVAGGPGALADYSIKIELDTTILDLDERDAENTSDHHTDLFPNSEVLVLRRGATFKILVTMSEEYAPGCHEIYLEAQDELEPGSSPIEIPASDQPVPFDQWGAERLDVTTNADGSRKVEIEVTIPPDVAAGKYTFKVLVREIGQPDPLGEEDFDQPVVILFNPWSTDDPVYLAADAERTEYVLSTNGSLWRGSRNSNSAYAWGYSQFTANTLKVALERLDDIDAGTRANPGLVARSFSAFVNSNGGGILTGLWPSDGNYPGGHNPSFWSNSGQIIDEYVNGGNSPVLYGQCWVFGGVLTTFLRALGVPARPLTNFESGHDSTQPPDKNVDWFFLSDGSYDHGEGKWNFHVWCDAWLGEWNAVDATPQELSDGEYQLGPAPVPAVHNDAGGAYDVDFVFGEVNADLRIFVQQSDGTYALNSTNTTAIGHNITTQALGGGASDITADYKTPEPGPRLPPGLLAVALDCPPEASLGQAIDLGVTSYNHDATERNLHLVVQVSAIGYNGDYFGSVVQFSEAFALAPGASRDTPVMVAPSDYLPWLLSTRFYRASAFLQDVDDSEATVEFCEFNLTGSGLLLTLDPADAIYAGATSDLTVSWVNPLEVAVDQAELSISTTEGLGIEGGHLVTIPIGSVPAHGSFQIQRSLTGLAPGGQVVGAFLSSATLTADASAELQVNRDCNGNGTDDALDIQNGTSQDCNGNDIPDECEADCNANGVPDGCDLLAGTATDCNGNGVPDECDISSGHSTDVNGNGLPDECDPDCNNNDQPDDLDIALGVSSDYNGNGVPDECDTDCNGNGVPDEVDIALGTSQDGNGNGVPDECEGAAQAHLVRSDVDASGEVNISDPIYNLAYQFGLGPAPVCLDAADDDNSGIIDISDPIYSLSYQFAQGPDPAAPYPQCGVDVGSDALDCAAFPPCGAAPASASGVASLSDDRGRFLLRTAQSPSAKRLRLEIVLEASVPLVGFEATFSYDPARLEYVGLEKSPEGDRIQFLSTRDDRGSGRIRLGGVPDFSLVRPWPAGRHSLGYRAFRARSQNLSADPIGLLSGVSFLRGRLVGSDLASAVIGGPSDDSPAPGVAHIDQPALRNLDSLEPPAKLTLLSPVPNPTTGGTRLNFGLSLDGRVRVGIFDVSGRELRTLLDREESAGWHSIAWDGLNGDAGRIPPGVYFARLIGEKEAISQRMIIMR